MINFKSSSNEWDRRGEKLQCDDHVSQSELMEFTEKAANNLLFFSKYFCRTELTPKQALSAKYLRNDQNFIGVYNRQGGKSTLFSVYDVHELAFREYRDGKKDFTMIFAPIKDQSRIIFGKVENLIKNNVFLSSLISKHLSGGTLETYDGNELQAKTASPNSHIRGFSPTKIQLDESQDITDVKYHEDIVPSGAATGAKLQEIGTPAKRNHFYKTYYHDKSFKRVKQTWKQCPFIDKKYVLNLLHSGQMTQSQFDQEFNCIWNVDAGAAWSFDLISLMCALEQQYYPPDTNYKYYAGIDVGKSPAETVLSIGKAVGDELYQIKLLRIGGKTYTEIRNELYKPLAIYEPLTCIDATKGSQGLVLFDMLIEQFSNDSNHRMIGNMIPEDYNNAMKSEMANDLELLGESNRLKLLNIDGQRRQMIAYEKKTSTAGNTIYYSAELSDICQANMLMVRSFYRHGTFASQGFKFAASGKAGALMDNTSFVNDLKNLDRPSW